MEATCARGVGVSFAGVGPHRRAQGAGVLVLRRCRARTRLQRPVLATNNSRIGAIPVHAGGHGQQLPQLDIGLQWIAQRKCFRQVPLGEYLGLKASGDPVVLFLEHDPAGNTGERLPDRRHIGMRFAIAFAEVLFVDQITVPHHHQAAMLAGFLLEFERLVKPAEIHASQFADLRAVR